MTTIAIKKEALSELLREAIRESKGQPFRVEGEDNQTVGFFVPFGTSLPGQPPERTLEQETEFKRRLAQIGDVFSHDEMIQRVMKDLP